MNDLVPVVEHDEPLPTFAGLNPRQSAFVRSYVSNGDGNATKAARDAGYPNSCAHSTGYRLLRSADVLMAIQRETAVALGAIMPIALKTQQKMLSAKSDFVKQQAAADLLDRGGFKAVDRHQVSVAGRVVVDIRMAIDD